jgi:acyl-CoA thioester hydrolase
MNTPATPVHTHSVRIYWEDTDAGGIVYYANYLKFFERSRSEWMRHLGVEQGALLANDGCMFVVSEAAAKYHRPARIDDLLDITVHIKQIGQASITLVQTAWIQPKHGSDDMPIMACQGTVRLACVRQSDMRPSKIPQHIAELLADVQSNAQPYHQST